MVEMKKANPPVGIDAILQFEKEFAISMPRDLKDFYLANNGGRPVNGSFDFYDPNFNKMNSSTIEQFFGFMQDRESDDDIHSNMEIFRERIPNGFLPIAEDPFGNLVCVGSHGPHENNVFFWDHEREVEEGACPDMSNMYLICSSFKKFLNGLRASKNSST